MFIFPKIIKHKLAMDVKLYHQPKRKLSFDEVFNLTQEGNGTVITVMSMDMTNFNIEKLYVINSNILVCKLMYYLYKVFHFINSSMTVVFSLERAFAISAPMKMRSIREGHKFLFKIIITVVVSYCFLYPTYYLYLLDIIKLHNGKQCRLVIKYFSQTCSESHLT